MTQRGVAPHGHYAGLGCSVTSLPAGLLLSLFVVASGSPRSIPWGEVGTLPPSESRLRPLAPCPCDTTSGNCDTGCCCDQDCRGANSAHHCIPGLQGGNPTPKITSFDCSDESTTHRPPLICVTTNNNPFLGNRFATATPIQTNTRLAELKMSRSRSDEFREFSRNSKLISGATKLIVRKKYLMSSPVMTGMEDNNELFYNLLTLPQPMFGTTCSNRPVRFLKNMKYSCVREMNKKSCVQDETFNALRYFIFSSDTYSDSNDTNQMPFLIGNLDSKETVPTNVRVFYHKDIYHRLKFTSNYGQFNANAKQAFESWYGNIQDAPAEGSAMTPVFDDTSSLCHNSVIGVSYIFTWKGSNITSINIDLEVGSVPVRTPKKLFSQSASNKEKSFNKRRVKIHLIQNFNIEFKYDADKVPHPTSPENTTDWFWGNETDYYFEINSPTYNESDSTSQNINYTAFKFNSSVENSDLNSTNDNEVLKTVNDVQDVEGDITPGSLFPSTDVPGSGQYPTREVGNTFPNRNDITGSGNSMGPTNHKIPADKIHLPGSGDFGINQNLFNSRETGSGFSSRTNAEKESSGSEQYGNSRTKRVVDEDIDLEIYEQIFSGFGAFDQDFPNSPDDDYSNNDQGSGFSAFQRSTVNLDGVHLTSTESLTTEVLNNDQISTQATTQTTNSLVVTQTHSHTSPFKTDTMSLQATSALPKRISVSSSIRPSPSAIFWSDETHTTHDMRFSTSPSRRVYSTRNTVKIDYTTSSTMSTISPRTAAERASSTATSETASGKMTSPTSKSILHKDSTASIYNDYDEINTSNTVDTIDSIDDSHGTIKYTDTPRASRVTRSTTNLKNASTTDTSENVLANYSSTTNATNVSQEYSETTQSESHVVEEEPTTTEDPQFESTETIPEEAVNASRTTTPIDIITADGDRAEIMDMNYEVTAAGYRGYIFGAPLIAANVGVPEVDYDTNDTRDVSFETGRGLLVWSSTLAAREGSLVYSDDPWDCDVADTLPLTFGQSVTSGCLMRPTDEELMDCASLREAALSVLRQLLPPSHLAALGHTDDRQHQLGQEESSVPVIGVDALLDSSFEPLVEWPEDADRVEGGGGCVVPAGVRYEILTFCAVSRGQHCMAHAVVGVTMRLQHERVPLTPFPGSRGVTSLWLASSAIFQEVTELPETARFWLKHGDPHCVGDVCWRDILRPWTKSPPQSFSPVMSQEDSRESRQLAEESWYAALHHDYTEGVYVDTATLLVLTLLVGLLTATQGQGLAR